MIRIRVRVASKPKSVSPVGSFAGPRRSCCPDTDRKRGQSLGRRSGLKAMEMPEAWLQRPQSILQEGIPDQQPRGSGQEVVGISRPARIVGSGESMRTKRSMSPSRCVLISSLQPGVR